VPPTLPAGVTLRTNCVEAVCPPLVVPVTVTVVAATGVVNEVATVRALVKVGADSIGLKPQLAPAGRPLHERVTSWGEPDVRVTVIVLEPSPPCVTWMPPEADTVKFEAP